jgi:hypothetical protein
MRMPMPQVPTQKVFAPIGGADGGLARPRAMRACKRVRRAWLGAALRVRFGLALNRVCAL